MEENKEKKRHAKKKSFRGKNNDRHRERDELREGISFGEPEAEDKPVRNRRGKQGKPDRRKMNERKSRQDEKKAPAKKEPFDDVEDRNPKLRREAEEPVFEFTWADAWGLYGTGYHVVIKDSQDKLYLSWSVDLSYGEMKLGQRLTEFLDDMKKCGIGSWDGKKYTKPGIFDGDTWSIKANSLILKVEAQGTNEYPPEWKHLLQCLHEKWTIPVSKREQWE